MKINLNSNSHMVFATIQLNDICMYNIHADGYKSQSITMCCSNKCTTGTQYFYQWNFHEPVFIWVVSGITIAKTNCIGRTVKETFSTFVCGATGKCSLFLEQYFSFIFTNQVKMIWYFTWNIDDFILWLSVLGNKSDHLFCAYTCVT